jgi:hypothetical protein
MAKFETWVALGSLGLGIMFVVLILSFYNFLIVWSKGPQISVDPFGATIQIVSISGAPSLILAGVVFGTARSTPEPTPALLLISTGIILIAGMSAARILSSKINALFVVAGLDLVPVIFIIGGIGIVAVGGYLLNTSKKARRNLKDKIL